MAIPRVSPVPSMITRTVADFPAFVAAREKLELVQQEFGEAQAEFNAAREAPRESRAERIRSEAAGILATDEATVATLPDLGELSRRLEVYGEACRIQRTILDREREAAANEICDGLRPKQKELIAAFLRAQTEAFAAYDQVQALTSQARAACDGELRLMELALPVQALQQFRHHCKTFESLATEYLGSN